MANFKWNALFVSFNKLQERINRLKTFDILMSEAEEGVWLMIFCDWAPWETIIEHLHLFSYSDPGNLSNNNGLVKRQFIISMETLVEKLKECNVSCYKNEKEYYANKINIAQADRKKIVKKHLNESLSVHEAVPPDLQGLVRPRDVDRWIKDFREEGLIVDDSVYGPKLIQTEP